MDIRERLRRHIDDLFRSAAQTRAIAELKEELFTNSVERYSDLTLQGRLPEDAYQIVVQSIGNVDELIAAAQAEPVPLAAAPVGSPQKKALVKAVCTGLYILAGITLLACGILSDLSEWIMYGGLIGAIFIAAIPTVILVYQAAAYPRYERQEETVVEDFKEWNNQTSRSTAVRKAVNSTIGTLTVVVYLLLSFGTNAWHITWIIFLISAAIQQVVKLIFAIKEADNT